jgi:uncharacterized hydrophobic protein (TIGR00271 family)
MLHVRVISPPQNTADVVDRARSSPAATNVVVLPGAAREPAGDLVMLDVAREGAEDLLADLRDLGLAESGSIAVEQVDLALSRAAEEAKDRAPGFGSDAVVTEELAARTEEEAELSGVFVAFMGIAGLLAAVGILTDSEVSIIGAMIVGPEFGPLAAVCAGLVLHRAAMIRSALRTLAVGFGLVLVTSYLFVLAVRLAPVDVDPFARPRPLTAFIWTPSGLSLVVALLAGVAGMLSLTSARSATLLGVLVSVTTIPAAANVSVALAYGHPTEAAASLLQLGLNVAGIIGAGVLALTLQRRLWRRYGRPRRLGRP